MVPRYLSIMSPVDTILERAKQEAQKRKKMEGVAWLMIGVDLQPYWWLQKRRVYTLRN